MNIPSFFKNIKLPTVPKKLSSLKDNREGILVGCIMAAVFIGTALAVNAAVGTEAVEETSEAEIQETENQREKLRFHRPKSLLKDIAGDDDEDEEFKPAADTLNMAYYYANDADTSDAINSYAGETFRLLNTKNADYLASFYDLTDTAPLTMAAQLGLGKSRVMGKYDPTDSSHDPADSSTWTINAFDNVSVTFYDGDGNRINGYYVAQEIMSLASVYMYYHNDYDPEHFKDYCTELFNNAISSKVSMGSVYYCGGCLNRTIQQESAEALAMEAERLANENRLSVSTALSSGYNTATAEALYDSTSSDLSGSSAGDGSGSTMTIEEIIDIGTDDNNSNVVTYESEAPETSAQEDISGTETSQTGQSLETGAAAETTASAAAESAAETLSETTAVPAETSIEEISDPNLPNVKVLGASYVAEASSDGSDAGDKASFGFVSGISRVATAISETPAESETAAETPAQSEAETNAVIYAPTEAPEETEAEESSSYAVINSDVTEAPKAIVGDDGNIIYTDTLPSDASYSLDNTSAGNSTSSASGTGTEDSEQAAAIERINSLLRQADIQTEAESYCPGHIDIYVTITIRGIDDKRGLFAADKQGNDEANFTDDWQGWTDDKIEEARSLNGQDWFELYGLSISSISLTSQLTEEEIQNYLNSLPADTSQLRKDIVKFALDSVGRVPYYWGGKPSGAGYSVNNFNTLIAPDTRGRILKGLDCSGWINWVYWSVTGRSLAGQSTGTLVGCGRKISRSQLTAGDIIIRSGDDAHVVMFLCWAGDGDFYAIHETGGVINNVTVSKMTANWPYYRSLCD